MDIVADLEALQAHACGICGLFRDVLVLDHDHDSGFIRGLLCHPCNRLEGRHAQCEPLDAASCPVCMWRATPAVSWLGYTERYWSSFPIDGEHEFRSWPWAPAHERAAAVKEASDRRREAANDRAARLATPEVAS